MIEELRSYNEFFDRKREPATLAGNRLPVHLGERTARGGWMIEDAGHLDNLTHRQCVGVLTGRIQAEPEPIPNVSRGPGHPGLDEHLGTPGSQGEPPGRQRGAVDITVARDQTSHDRDRGSAGSTPARRAVGEPRGIGSLSGWRDRRNHPPQARVRPIGWPRRPSPAECFQNEAGRPRTTCSRRPRPDHRGCTAGSRRAGEARTFCESSLMRGFERTRSPSTIVTATASARYGARRLGGPPTR